jgi:hypothetical protein
MHIESTSEMESTVAAVLDDLVQDSHFFDDTSNPPRIIAAFDPNGE